MKPRSLARQLSRTLLFIMVCAAICMASLAVLSILTLKKIASENQSHAQSFVPAKRLTTQFEREILNARIFFIYFVTIQKPNSLESGWKRYHNAELRLEDLSLLVNQYDQLAGMRGPVAKLRVDLASYNVALTATMSMVQHGELKGPHYDAQVKEWAARGAVMVGDAATVESLCFKLGEANTDAIINSLNKGQVGMSVLFIGGLVFCFIIALRSTRHLDESLAKEYADVVPLIPPARQPSSSV